MTSSAPWKNHFDGSYANTNENTSAWNRSLVNTPQTNPAGWPQLGSSGAESEPNAQQQTQEESNWTPTIHNTTASSETSGSAWGRLANENNSQNKPCATGWGAPSAGPAWGQQTTVDNGTSVWGKSTNTQPQANWGSQPTAQPPQANDSAQSATGWGTNNVPSANSAEPNTQTITTTTTTISTIASQPVSWAKAAAAGLPSSNECNEATPSETVQDSNENTPTSLPNASLSIETDTAQKLVNSHEGWGKKPIQQGTSWNIGDSGSGFSRPPNQVNNGTEAWGNHGGGQASSGTNWGDAQNTKSSSNWTPNPPYQPAAPGQAWGGPSQQPPQQLGRSNYPSGNGPVSGWGDHQQPQQSAINNGRWTDMSNQNQAPTSGWGAPPVPQQPVTPGWSGNQSGANNTSNWGPNPHVPVSQGSNWGGNMVQQPPIDQSSWGRSVDSRGGVDNGTAAWGDPLIYSKVSLWDKRAKPGANNEAVAGQMPPMNTQVKPTGWGVPNSATNRPSSPKGWGDNSPTRTNPSDNGTAAWNKPLGGEKWEKNSSGNNWNTVKPNSAGWGQQREQHWVSPETGPSWGQNDGLMKNNMKYNSRGYMPQPNLNQQQMMLRNQTPSNMPTQAHFQQIQHAVMNGIVPPQVLNPQLMTPQHVHNVLQLITKTSEVQKLQNELSAMMNQNKAMPNVVRQQQIEQSFRLLRQNQNQLEIQKGIIIHTMLQKAQPNPSNKLNNPLLGGGNSMELSRMRPGSATQPMVSPLNNMNPMMQALPSAGLPSVTSPTARDESRFLNNWKQPNNFSSMGDNILPLNSSNIGLGMGPGGDSAFTAANFRHHHHHHDEFSLSERTVADGGALSTPRDSTHANVDASTSAVLADIGPPEFTPGVPWKGFRTIDPEADPNITPGSVAIAKTMSINTVRDADQVLNRDRSIIPETPGSTNSTGNLTNTSSSNNNDIPQIWSTAGDSNNWSGQVQDNRGAWLVLTNFNHQVDPNFVQNLCTQHGTVTSFQPHYPMEGMALVKYFSPDEAANAKKALNMTMVGSTMLVATVATDQEVSNFMTATSGGSWTAPSRFVSGASNAYISQVSQREPSSMPSTAPPQQYWGANHLNNATPGTTWAGSGPHGLSWSRATGEDSARVMSPMHSLLPENLLGGEAI